jgi:hypothetical protein
VLASLALAGACDGGDRDASDGRRATRVAAAGVPLAQPATGFRRECEDAASSLGFAVPCPTKLPLVGGKPVDCSDTCVVTGGNDKIFFLNIEGYDAAPSSQAVRHMIVEAREVDRAPPSPCAGGTPTGRTTIVGREVALLDCPPRTAELERQIMHAEGAHTEHILGYWDEKGVREVVSVHGATEANTLLLRQVVASIEIVQP